MSGRAKRTVTLTTRSIELPEASRIAFTFRSACRVCSCIVVPTISVGAPPGRTAIWPETNTNPLATTAWEYGECGAGYPGISLMWRIVIAASSWLSFLGFKLDSDRMHLGWELAEGQIFQLDFLARVVYVDAHQISLR